MNEQGHEKQSETVVSGIVVKKAIPMEPAKIQRIPKLNPRNAEYFNNTEIQEPEPIIDNILYPGLGILGAPNKFGKSYTVLLLCCDVATGDPFLGFQIKRPGRVLYLDLEGTEARTKKRLSKIGFPVMPEKLHIQYKDNVRTIDQGLLEQLSEWMKDNPDTILICIDMWKNVIGRTGRSEDSYTATNRMLTPLQAFAIKHNISVFITLHTRKGNTGYTPDDPFENITGSNAQFGTADCGWMLLGRRDEPNKRFVVLCRDNDEGQQEFEVTFENFRYKIIGTHEELQKERERIEYDNNPVVFTIKAMLENNDTWIVTSSELRTTILLKTGESFEGKNIGTMLDRKLKYLLGKYDNIMIIPPSKNGGIKGRKYTFKKRKLNQKPFI